MPYKDKEQAKCEGSCEVPPGKCTCAASTPIPVSQLSLHDQANPVDLDADGGGGGGSTS